MPADSNIFKNYPNRIFIETGSLIGDGIQNALDSGFKIVFSIELSKMLYNICVDRYKDNDNVHIILGDSSEVLGELLTMIKEPITFWLDGHYSGEPTAKGKVESPLMYELEIIRGHPIKTHTLIIDDLRCWTINNNGFDVSSIVKKIRTINPNYKFIYENGYIPDDILIAKI